MYIYIYIYTTPIDLISAPRVFAVWHPVIVGKCAQDLETGNDDYNGVSSLNKYTLSYAAQFGFYFFFRLISVGLNFVCCFISFLYIKKTIAVKPTGKTQMTLPQARDSVSI